MSRPLEGVKVVSLAINLPGPLAAARLAEMGATVTKVEPPSGDPLAAAAADWYSELTAKQTVVTLDMKADRPKLDELLAEADLLITSMRPSALERMGLARPHEQFPQLSLIEIVGHPGDRAEIPGHDLNYQAVHGILTPPHLPKVPIADVLGGERAVSAALAALVARGISGQGAAYRVALEEAAQAAGAAVRHGVTGPDSPLGGVLPVYNLYQCADGYVALGAIEPHFFVRALEVCESDGTYGEFQKFFADKTKAELEAIAAEYDLPLNGVR